MKLEKKVGVDYKSNAIFEGKDASIDASSMGKLWGFLQDPYKNPVGAIVREYVSNAFDAHVEASFIKISTLSEIRTEYPIYLNVSDKEINELKKQLQIFNDDAVYVRIGKDQTGNFWSTEDFGVGLSPQRVEDVFCSYLKSTKESTNNVIGCFGIGSKSGLSYADVIHIRSRYNGVKHTYMLRKGEVAPRLDILSSEPTTERNGTQIKIYIKKDNYGNYENNKFILECKRQLAYFDNVYFDDCQIQNNYTILQGENWIKSSNGNPFDGLHLCLGKVAYPIDWDNLGIPKIVTNVALKFEIGELDIIQTREDVRYIHRTKKAIIDKIEAFKKELQFKWETDKPYEIYSLKEYFRIKNKSMCITYGDLSGYNFDIELNTLLDHSAFSSWSFMPFKNIGIKVPDEYEIFFEYYSNTSIKKSSLQSDNNNDIWRTINQKDSYNASIPYRIKSEHIPKKSRYIRHELEKRNIVLIRKYTAKAQGSGIKLKNYVRYLGLKWDDRVNWRAKIKVFQSEVQKYLISETKSYEGTEIDPQWLKNQQIKRSTIDKTKVLVNYLNSRTWETERFTKGELDKMNRHLFVMGIKEQKCDLEIIADIMMFLHGKRLRPCGGGNHAIASKSFLRVGYVALTNLKYVKNVKNLITVGNFKQSRPFIRAITAYHISISPKYQTILNILENYNPAIWNNVYEPIADMMQSAKEYLDANSAITADFYYSTSSLILDGYKFVQENELLEKKILQELDFISEYLNNIPFLNNIVWQVYDNPDKEELEIEESITTDIIKSILMHNKVMPRNQFKKINAYYYASYNGKELSWMKPIERNLLNYLKIKS